MEFERFPKIARLSREMIVTEKIDGTNSLVFIDELDACSPMRPVTAIVGGLVLHVGSSKRWMTPENDHFGFAAWVRDNAEEIALLGTGRHHGEWWGSGIQRGYGLPKGERRWSLFNTKRWHAPGDSPREFAPLDPREPPKVTTQTPPCVGVVPVLYQGLFDTETALDYLEQLRCDGSHALPGFGAPEGIVVFHVAGNVAFKATLEGDGVPKSMKAQEPKW